MEYVKKCDKYQKHAHIVHQPAIELHPIINLWPFEMWGLDIMGPFPRGSGKISFLLVRSDYFMKWVEAVLLVNLGESNIKTFLWKNIITRFGIPKAFVSINGTQFKNHKIQDFCNEYGIK